MKLNPYIAGNPVGGGEAFIGRADVLRDVLRVLKSPSENGMVLYGQRRIGKTSVLQELAANLPQQGPYAPVYFDLQDKAALPLEQVLHELANRILYDLDISEFENENENFVKGFQKEFLPYVLSQLPEETALVLLFDEFDVLDNPSEKQAGSAFFPYLRDLMSLDTKHLKFVFVIGRRPEDLSSLTLSVFKGVKSRHVSLLSKEDTAALVRLSEQNDSLKWTDEGIILVHNLTGGHPYLTQQLCQVIWENIYDDEPEGIPVIQACDMKQAVHETLKSSTSSLEWLWDGLGSAERVVASALAEAGPGIISQEKLEKCLQESGVRILIEELQDAPRVLEEWDLIRPENEGYCIPVELLRRWIAQRKPLVSVQDEIDRADPVADHLFQAAYGFYQGGQFQRAIPLLQQAIGLNPNHLKANQLLADIFLAQGNLAEAREILEPLYEYNPIAARPRLIQVLLSQAKEEAQINERLVLYRKVLELDYSQPEALAGYQKIFKTRVMATMFLVHSSVDKPLVKMVANALCRHGIIPWFDESDLIVGSGLFESLQKAISELVSIALFLSEQALASRWVRDEFQEALKLEDESYNKDWILPVYLNDPLELVSSHQLLAERWLSTDKKRVDRLGIYIPSSEGGTPESIAESIADKLSQSVYNLLDIKAMDGLNIAIDQRGRGSRTGQYELPQNIAAKLDYPTLVFRPDTGIRSFSETLIGEQWVAFCQSLEKSLSEALGNLITEKKIRILGDGQLGLAFFLGQYFDRTTSVSLYCYNIRHGTVFTNEGQEWRGPLSGGNPNCEIFAKKEDENNTLLPPKISPGEKHHTIALYIGKRNYLHAVIDHLETAQRHLPLVFIQTEFFNNSEEVMALVRDVVALLQRLREQNGTTTIRLYCNLPFNVVPLLSANLTYHVMNTIEFMEFRGDLQAQGRSPQDMYVHLPMK